MFIDTSRVLNYRTWIMSIDRSQPDITVAHTLAMDIGMSYHTKAESEGTWWETTTRTAVYANINGNEYGELVSVKNNRKSNLFDFNLDQNYPNPFNPSTKIKYQISELSFVTLKVFDVLGNETITLVNEEKTAGNYEVEFNGTELTSGIYFYRIQAGNYVETMKMVLMK
ncbi:MAG: T9SS type A sorting domain-containing protein [Ignavibacteria bacterium]|nr:T9SS type A sorting domain-containing protein [Ignavibacteria bacterium]MBT8381903.1 T9SS type A sorting domain-containing protein [Ignavibacteria bacterium]MBT8390832.1 T9SS type A sorting domain-containing protein [Ignavibacteria bacterium]NNL22373.1 T9SS type A sorting domain-containing protein [Ignavibacteriaceae bacterium]